MTNRVSRVNRLAVLFVGTLILCGSAPGHYRFLSAANDFYEVELIRWERLGPSYDKVRFGLLVRQTESKEERVVTVENLTTELDRAEIAGETLLLFGEMGGKAGAITLVDLETAEATDFILHYAASLSPSRRYLVFKAFYAPYGMLQTRSDSVMIYDLSRQPAANRLPRTRPSTMGTSVGLPVYPPENVDPASYQVWIPNESLQHYVEVQAGFLWARDEKSLYFIDRTRNQQLLVRIDLTEGLEEPQIITQPIDPASILAIAPERNKQFHRGKEANYFAITGMQFAPDGRIRLELNREMFDRKVYRVTHISIVPPEARPPTQGLAEEPQ